MKSDLLTAGLFGGFFLRHLAPSASMGIAVFLLAHLLSGCTEGTQEEGISEGYIEYVITYPNTGAGHPLANLLPSEMKFYFKDDRTSTEMKTGMGMMKTAFIADSDERQLHIVLKLFEERIASTLSGEDVKKIHEHLGKLIIEEVKGSKVIAGYKCKKATIRFPDSSRPEATFYYTEDIRIKDPNWSLAYSTIPGVLLDYEMEQNGILMRFEARRVVKAEVDDEQFVIQGDYKMVPPDVIEKKMQEISESFRTFE